MPHQVVATKRKAALNCLTEEVEEKVEAPLQPNGLQLP
jgi:hypothetical protein